VAEGIHEALLRSDDSHAERWRLIAAYLRRVEAFYSLSGAYTAPQEAS
jgi:hypothetical protein